MENFSAPGVGRRSFIGGVFAAAGGVALSQETKTNEPPKLARNPLVYQFKIGGIDAWSISDGHSLMGKGNPLGMMWPEEDRPKLKAWMEERNERMEGIPLYINILVIRRGKEVILFDAGFRPGRKSNWVWLGDGLAQIGIAPDQVTAGFLSHAHGDHLEGFVRDGKPAFPNAAFHYLPVGNGYLWHPERWSWGS